MKSIQHKFIHHNVLKHDFSTFNPKLIMLQYKMNSYLDVFFKKLKDDEQTKYMTKTGLTHTWIGENALFLR